MSSLREDHELLQSTDTMEVATSNEFIVASSLPGTSDSSTLLSTPTLSNVGTSTTDSINFLTVQNQNGQLIIQQPIKTTNNGPTLVNNGASLPKGHIIVRQKPVGGGQQSLSASSSVGDVLTLEKAGMKRPLPSSGSNVITKVIITKNPISGQPQALQAGPPSQTFTITTLPSSGSVAVNSLSATSVVNPSGTPTKTVTLTSQGILSPVKTVIATIPSAGTSKLNIPYKIPISPSKAPTKITMIPVSRSPNKQVLNPANITVLSRALTTLAQTGNAKPGSPSKVIIKQGPAPTGSAITLKSQSLPNLAPQTAQPIRTAQVVQSIRGPNITQNIRPVAISSAGNVQQIQVPGSRFHYVRLVSPASGANSQTTTLTAVSKPITATSQLTQSTKVVPVTSAPLPTSHLKITLPIQQNATLAPKPSLSIPITVNTQPSMHRIILPATSTNVTLQGSTVTSLAPIQPAPTVSIQNVNQLPPGSAILSTNATNIQGMQSFAIVPALVPASYVTQMQHQFIKPQTTQAAIAPSAPRQTRDYVPIASIDPAVTQYTVSRNAPAQNGPTLEATGARPRKPCNCTKSQCLKLYCDCFANGEFCQNCNCTNCANNLEHEEERSKAIKSCLDRNPQAFHPKIGKAKDVEGNRRHTKGCNCKRSGCLKNYCECYEAKIMCSNFCKCIGCKNFEESPERKTLMHLADAAEVRVQQQTAAKTKLSSQISCVPSRPPTTPASGERLPFALITSDVAEATCACLLAQAEEAERMKMPAVVQERMVIEEFGRCLMQIIDSANRTRTTKSVA
ncbi:protein lin-54 homolog [Physella acuta]|uniref:protein lin-54 homolog n=1 Tax=Physella acuta TaxID=109671 RepID=UPI0027DE5158|nr:protein lin-54 homolog [Physella acuta]